MTVNLHIDRLVLDGLPIGAQEGPLVQAAIEAELARLIVAHGVTAARRNFEAPLGRPRHITIETLDVLKIGTAIGHAIYGGVPK